VLAYTTLDKLYAVFFSIRKRGRIFWSRCKKTYTVISIYKFSETARGSNWTMPQTYSPGGATE